MWCEILMARQQLHSSYNSDRSNAQLTVSVHLQAPVMPLKLKFLQTTPSIWPILCFFISMVIVSIANVVMENASLHHHNHACLCNLLKIQ